jgi:hypothetical protein
VPVTPQPPEALLWIRGVIRQARTHLIALAVRDVGIVTTGRPSAGGHGWTTLRLQPSVADHQRQLRRCGNQGAATRDPVSLGERPRTTMVVLVVEERELQVISSPVELAEGAPPADVVVSTCPPSTDALPVSRFAVTNAVG